MLYNVKHRFKYEDGDSSEQKKSLVLSFQITVENQQAN